MGRINSMFINGFPYYDRNKDRYRMDKHREYVMIGYP